MTKPSLNDCVIDAARATRDVYITTVGKHLAKDRQQIALDDIKRAALMEQLSNDLELCEMFAGRLNQFMAGFTK